MGVGVGVWGVVCVGNYYTPTVVARLLNRQQMLKMFKKWHPPSVGEHHHRRSQKNGGEEKRVGKKYTQQVKVGSE